MFTSPSLLGLNCCIICKICWYANIHVNMRIRPIPLPFTLQFCWCALYSDILNIFLIGLFWWRLRLLYPVFYCLYMNVCERQEWSVRSCLMPNCVTSLLWWLGFAWTALEVDSLDFEISLFLLRFELLWTELFSSTYCLEESQYTKITLIEPGTFPWIRSLEGHWCVLLSNGACHIFLSFVYM